MENEESIKKWVATWHQAADSLQSQRIRELADKNYYIQHRQLLNSMLQYAFDHRTVRTSSGFVTLQKLFKEEMISSATCFHFLPDFPLLTCSAEDLIILKSFADRFFIRTLFIIFLLGESAMTKCPNLY